MSTEASLSDPIKNNTGNIVQVSKSSGGDSSSIVTSSSRATADGYSRPNVAAPNSTRTKKLSPKAIHRASAIFASCAELLADSVGEENKLLRLNGIAQVHDALRELWEMRSDREDSFAELVNMLQGIFIDRTADDFSDQELLTLEEVCTKLSNEPQFDDAFANEITMSLVRGGVDAFREIL